MGMRLSDGPNALYKVCPADIPETVEDCRKLYLVYESFDDGPASYPQYESERCVVELTCEQRYDRAKPPADADPSKGMIPYAEYRQRFC